MLLPTIYRLPSLSLRVVDLILHSFRGVDEKRKHGMTNASPYCSQCGVALPMAAHSVVQWCAPVLQNEYALSLGRQQELPDCLTS